MRASLVYPLLWIAWIAAFLAIELSALWSGHSNFTLSAYCWRLEQINRRGRPQVLHRCGLCVAILSPRVPLVPLGEGRVKHCGRCGQQLPDFCWCPDDDEDDEPDEGCGEDGPGDVAA